MNPVIQQLQKRVWWLEDQFSSPLTATEQAENLKERTDLINEIIRLLDDLPPSPMMHTIKYR